MLTLNALSDPVVLFAGQAITADTVSEVVNLGSGRNVTAAITISALSGTSPSALVGFEWSHDGVNFFQTIADGLGTLSTVSSKGVTIPVRGPFFRVPVDVSGTSPSLTVTLSVYAS